MKILFHTNQLSLRGTEIAVFDYADYNEKLLHNDSVIAVKRSTANHPLVEEKFNKRFQVIYYDTLEELEEFVHTQHIDIFYTIKSGQNDGLLLKDVKNCVHAVFKHYEPHGDVYAYISKWLSNEMSAGKMPYVPHIVRLPKSNAI